MQIPSHGGTGDLGFNMTPMIDVVFLLIIFFLVSSHLAKQEAQMELPLPAATSGSDPIQQQKRLTLNVLQDGRFLLAGRRLSPADLEARLRSARASEGDELEVRIRSHRDVAFEYIEPLMLACARAGIWNVTFGVVRRGE